ncbi:MAG: hypothetical protein GY760_23515 [Deltaproteobacteria bacterium]|nr:hypothetical protein [Deltaproteobacteria bacterium]
MNKDYEIKKIKHLNCVLRSLRDVGRLIVTQGDKKNLLVEFVIFLLNKGDIIMHG